MKIRTKHQILVKIWQDCALARENDIEFENYHHHELHKSLQKFFVEVGKCNFVMLILNVGGSLMKVGGSSNFGQTSLELLILNSLVLLKDTALRLTAHQQYNL